MTGSIALATAATKIVKSVMVWECSAEATLDWELKSVPGDKA
jgi:hypothetical protein